jgi:hypothetical protein
MSEAADVPAQVIVVRDPRDSADDRPRVAQAEVHAVSGRAIGDDTLAPEWDITPAPRSRPPRADREMSDDLLRPDPLRMPRRRFARGNGPLGDELIEPDWAALLPRGRLVRALGPLGDDPLPPDWTWRASADAAAMRLGYAPLGDDVLRADWAAAPPRALQLGYGPLGDDVLTPDDTPGAERLEATRGRREVSGAVERATGRALARPAAESIDENRDTLPID